MCLSSNQEVQAIPIRPHHGMCLAYFIGKGYSEGFSAHMEKMLGIFRQNVPVKLVVHTDEICSRCPNNEEHLWRLPVEQYLQSHAKPVGVIV